VQGKHAPFPHSGDPGLAIALPPAREQPAVSGETERLWNSTIPQGKVHVTVDKGWVTLQGDGEWQYQCQEAERAVRRLLGVKGVSI